MPISKPNLFEISTQELSQDAFITWLLQWADKKYAKADEYLHHCAQDFVKSLINQSNGYHIAKVQAGRQWKNIDVWCKVNDDYFLVIEDKKGTKQHTNQLERYADIAQNHFSNLDLETRCIYFKMEEQGNMLNLSDTGFMHFTRSQMLPILKKYKENTENSRLNDILLDYYDYLVKLDEDINSYKSKSVGDWGWYSWIGFFAAMREVLGGTWDYVPNPSGGFLGLWWDWHYGKLEDKEFEFYLQMEYDKLVFKLYVFNEENRHEVRDYFRKKLFSLANKKNIQIQKYGRIGKYMGVARLAHGYRVTDQNKILDMDSTKQKLEDMKNLLSDVEKEISRENQSDT
jgi:hypothetical protein